MDQSEYRGEAETKAVVGMTRRYDFTVIYVDQNNPDDTSALSSHIVLMNVNSK